MANPKNIHYYPNGPLPDCDCDEVDDCWICRERHDLSFFKKCDECGHNRMYWENEQERAEKEDRLEDVQVCWKCVMCPCCGDGPASTGEVCESEDCADQRAIPPTKSTFIKENGEIVVVENGVRTVIPPPNEIYHCFKCDQDKEQKDSKPEVLDVGRVWCRECWTHLVYGSK